MIGVETTRSICFFLVSACLTVIAQQIHSLRASGVRLSQIFNTFELVVSAFRKSDGRVCTVPPNIFLPSIDLSYLGRYFSGKKRKTISRSFAVF